MAFKANRILASRQDKERAELELKFAFEQGRIDFDELSQRLGKIHSVVYYSDLERVLSGIPTQRSYGSRERAERVFAEVLKGEIIAPSKARGRYLSNRRSSGGKLIVLGAVLGSILLFVSLMSLVTAIAIGMIKFLLFPVVVIAGLWMFLLHKAKRFMRRHH